jgi:hypothetical protein
MNNQHPITPPLELVQQWVDMLSSRSDQVVFNQAAQWGADQELEACCAEVSWNGNKALAVELRNRRRPKPTSLKEQALDALREAESTGCLYVNGRSDLIRKALEALSND